MKDSAIRLGRALLCSFLFLFLCVLLVGCEVLPGNSSPTRASRIRIASSAALLPLISAAVALFERQHPEARIAVQHYESVEGLNRLADQQVDIAATTLYADPSVAYLRDALFSVVPYLIVVQRDAPLVSLSQAQIQRIFSSGQITGWQQVGGPKQKVVVVLPPLTSDVRFVFREEVLGSAAEVGNALPTDSLETLRDMAARTPGSISYLPAPLSTSEVHAVAIDGERATAEQIASGGYSFWSFAHLYSRDSSTPGTEETMLFLQFMHSPEVAQLALHLGYISLSEMNAAPV